MRLVAAAPLASVAAAAAAGDAAAPDAAAFWSAVQHDLGICLVTFTIPIVLVLLTEVLKDTGRLSAAGSRKLLHIATGPAFVLTWGLYSDAWPARWVAMCHEEGVFACFSIWQHACGACGSTDTWAASRLAHTHTPSALTAAWLRCVVSPVRAHTGSYRRCCLAPCPCALRWQGWASRASRGWWRALR
jgi:hypothetical protein